MSSILVGGFTETGDWVYNPTIDDYEWIVTGGQGFPACPECCECAAPLIEGRYRVAIKYKVGTSISPCSGAYPIVPHFLTTTTVAVGDPNIYCTGEISSGCSASSASYNNVTGPQTTGNGTWNTDTELYTFTSTGSARCVNITYGSPYSTSLLISNTNAALEAQSYTAWGNSYLQASSRNLDPSESSYAIAEAQYRFRFKVPKVGNGSKYIITWVERFSPEGGGTPTDTVKTFTWDGVIPDGYDPADFETFPMSDEYTLAIPATDGTVEITSATLPGGGCITATCSGTAPTDPCNP